ncbi:cyclase family protein [Streptomyces sp. A1499]|uniref:cyclase family protein n=1 Tax=Streptomyces sp. A1499 TaxID=2563104 RepID=UPI00109E8323|nr:cyclase family protein [Streptomyces sp. A1499]THC43116.1 cyclase family protein [Streptomyces sp. A1499]
MNTPPWHDSTHPDDEHELPSNWGRWGTDDELGTLNLITEEVRARGAAEVRTGRAVSLAQPIHPAPLVSGPFAPTTRDVSPIQQLMQYTGGAPATADMMLVTNHHVRSTHLDALGHQVRDGRVYPGRPLAESVTPAGARHGSTVAFAAGIVTRGVLLDLAFAGPLPAGHPITSEDFEAAEARQGLRLESGDALVVRCGWVYAINPARPMPGISLEAVRWMHRRGVSLYAGDLGDAHPPLDPAVPGPLHRVALPLLGMPLIDVAELEELAAVCAESNRYTFLLTVVPPRIHGLTGVPVNPLAIF